MPLLIDTPPPLMNVIRFHIFSLMPHFITPLITLCHAFICLSFRYRPAYALPRLRAMMHAI